MAVVVSAHCGNAQAVIQVLLGDLLKLGEITANPPILWTSSALPDG
jgi:hypothetical protein